MSTQRDLDLLVRDLKGKTPLRASALLFAVVALLGTALIWACVTEVDDVTRAPGRVVPAGDVQKVQAAQAGVIRHIYVAEGDTVAAGAPLVELDALVQTSQLDQEAQKAFALQARMARLTAEIDGTRPVFPADLQAKAPELLASEQALYDGRAASLQADMAVLTQQREQRRQEQTAARNEIGSAGRAQGLLAEEMAIVSPLVDSGAEPRTSLLTLQRQQEDATSRLSAAQSKLAQLNTALAEVEDQMTAARTKFRSDALRDLSDATAALATLRPTLPALQSMAARAVLRAPVAGIVNRLQRRTLGGSVREGEDVAEIVPLDDALLVEAYVLPKDIAFLRPDQPVKVKLTAYEFSRYGALQGKILRIGADAVRRSERDEAEVFVVVIQTQGALYDADGKQARVIPGMAAEIDILSGHHRVIDYLLQPIERVRDRAFRE